MKQVVLYKLVIETSDQVFNFISDLSGFKDLRSIRKTHELSPEFKGSSIEVITVDEDIARELLGE